MSACEFSLSRYAERLETGGVPRGQALMHAELTAEILRTLVTEGQLQEALAAQELRVKDFFRAEIRAGNAALEAGMDAKMAGLKAYFAESQTGLVKWLFLAFSTQAALIIAVLKLFP